MILNQGGGGIVPKKTIDETTITPGTTDHVIDAQTYLRGKVTIEGEPNLVPENIPVDTSIFGVAGTKELEILNGSRSTYKAGETIEPGNFVTIDYKKMPASRFDSTQYKRLVFPDTDLVLTVNNHDMTSSLTTTASTTLYRVSKDGNLTRLSNLNIDNVPTNALGTDYSGAAYITQFVVLDSKRFAVIYAQATGQSKSSGYSNYYEVKTGIRIYVLNDSHSFTEELKPTRLPNTTWIYDSTTIQYNNYPRVTGALPYSDLNTDKRLIVFMETSRSHDTQSVQNYGYSILDYTATPKVSAIVQTTHSISTTGIISSDYVIGQNYKDSRGNYHIVSLSKKTHEAGTYNVYCWTYVKLQPLQSVSQIVMSPITEFMAISATSLSNMFVDIWGSESDAGVNLKVAYNSYVTGLNIYETNNGVLGAIEVLVPYEQFVPTIKYRKDKIPLSYPLVSLVDRSEHNYSGAAYSNAGNLYPCGAYFLSDKCVLLTIDSNTYSALPNSQVAISIGNPFNNKLSKPFKPRLITLTGASAMSYSFRYESFVCRNRTQTNMILSMVASGYISGNGVLFAYKENFVPALYKCTTTGNYDTIDGISTSSAVEGQDVTVIGLKGD